ncbi:maleylpyruvate isomerase family mycothiol-dependent enzyme [Aeromicrobium sp.]|uniref:maleylpyruvate isomerase family mycothiol-dependent enzyme n=1 Tax=Aeromicrobium sp. TaxID=1871063 RepID=UPI0030C25C44
MTIRSIDPEADDPQPLAGPQLRALADALAAQPASVADLPSLCEGWAVRHVLAHMTMAARYDSAAFQAELAAAAYDFPVLSETVARRDGQLSFEELLTDLSGETMAAWTPPGGGSSGALSHAVIHGLDITSAVGLPRTASDQAVHLVLDILTVGGVHQEFGTRVGGLALRASDLDWSYGAGRPVEAEAADLILALAGRPRPGVDLPSA